MKFAATAAAVAILAGTPAMAQVFTITGTRIPGEARDVISAKTFVQDGITIITGTRIPTAVAAAITPAATPTTLETRIVTSSYASSFEEPVVDAANKKTKRPQAPPKNTSKSKPKSTSRARVAVREESTSAPSAPETAPVETTSAPAPVSSAPAEETTSAPAPVKARDSVFVEKRCLALGAECGNNGVYTDCCDDQLCAENHGTGSLTCGGVSVAARDAPANGTLVEPVLEKRCLALGSECGDNGVYTDCCDNQLCAENHGTGSLTCGGVSV